MSDPITPNEIRTRPDKTEDAVSAMVGFINDILSMDGSVSLLLRGKQVTIFDSSNSDAWQAGHEGAIKRFQDVGWLIAHRESEKFGRVYFFQLRGSDPHSQVQIGGSNNTQAIK